jgi:hypothetical protein
MSGEKSKASAFLSKEVEEYTYQRDPCLVAIAEYLLGRKEEAALLSEASKLRCIFSLYKDLPQFYLGVVKSIAGEKKAAREHYQKFLESKWLKSQKDLLTRDSPEKTIAALELN